MKLVEKEQVMFGMLKGIEQEKWYSTWFEIAMKEMFKDPVDREQWMLELANAIKVYDTRQQKLQEEEEHIDMMAVVYGSLEDDERFRREEERNKRNSEIIVRW